MTIMVIMRKTLPDQTGLGRASVADLKARLSEYLRAVQSGTEVIVTDRGRPVARLVPAWVQATDDDRAKELVSRGLAREPRQPLPRGFWKLPRPDDPLGTAVERLLEERAEDR
jgi:prevent-host-death family protein